MRVGARDPVTVDARVVAATHRDLEAMIREGRFREDLWFRLNMFPIHIPPLRQRRDDIPALAHHFIERKAREMNLAERPRLAPGAIDDLLAYAWPGNVRELQNALERAVILAPGDAIELADLPDELARGVGASPRRPRGPGPVLDADRAAVEAAPDDRARILKALELSGGNRERTARLLGISRTSLWRRMRDLDLLS
jgi:DNA-binding NtrC family response regulator